MDDFSTDPAAPSEPPLGLPATESVAWDGWQLAADERRAAGPFPEDQLRHALPAITAEGLLPTLLELEALLASQLPSGQGRWRGLDAAELITHLVDHLDEVALDLTASDAETGHPTAAHVAARALMLLALALEQRR